MTKILPMVVVLVLAGHAYGHDLWLEREGKEGEAFALYYGHKHSGHGGPDRLDYDPAWVLQTLCFDDVAGKAHFETREGSPHRIAGRCAAACVLTSSGYWTKTPYGTENVPKAEARMPIRSWLSYESVKRMDGWSPVLGAPLTEWLEITPLSDPASARKGRKLRLRITFDRRPMEGVVVTYDGEPRGLTGRDGEINIRLRHGGFQVIQASLTRPDASGKADEVVHSANLNFELPEN